MRKKGISSDVLNRIFDTYSTEQEEKALSQAWQKLMRRSSMTEEKAVQSLLRKGFSYGLIRGFLEKL